MKTTKLTPLLCSLIGWCLSIPLAAAPSPVDLRIGEGFINPLGFHDATPSFSWRLPEGVKKQTAYCLEVNVEGKTLWTSGWVESDQSVFVTYGGAPLPSRQQATWRVRYRDEAGKESDWSQPARFELGLLANADWKASWIRPDVTEPASGKVEILSARYRSKANPGKGRDVTALLRNALKDGRLAIQVNNEKLGGDPAELEVKTLEVTYKLDGKEQKAVFAENVQAVLPPTKMASETVATLRRGFPLSKPVKHARLYVTARGVFDLQLNGERVGRDHFANGWTSHGKRLDTLTYDVTSQLKPGQNAIQARLAAGWYAGRLGWQHDKSMLSRKAELLLQLEITHRDGSTETIVSDGNWEGTFKGPILSSGLYDGEVYDARIQTDGWHPVIVNAVLGTSRLTPKPFPPVRAIETLATRTITEPQPGRLVFDLGQNMVGWAKLKIPVVKNQTVTIRFAEMLEKNGTLYTANYRSAKSTDSYTAAATGTVEWEPAFTFHGFRYVELSGFPEGTKPSPGWVTGAVLHSDLRRTGSFTSSHAKLNQLQGNIVWGQRGNFLDIPTDCPQRDERLGWTGDAQVFAATAMFNYDCHAFFKSWLGSMRDDQLGDGSVPFVIPNILGNGSSPGWQDAATIIPWAVYLRTGDREMLAENYAMMDKLVAWYRGKTRNGLGFAGHAFGDWLQPFAKTNQGDTPKDLIGAAFYAHSAQLLADAARVLGKDDDAKRFAAEAAAVKNSFIGHFLDAEGKLRNAPETQTGYLLALEFNLVPDDLRAKSVTRLLGLVQAADGHLRTGFLGTPYLAPILDRHGHPDVAFGVLFKETYPSWFYSINQGATTMWERWNSYSHDKGFGDVSMNSFNHYAYGAIGQWMYERIAGLEPDPARPGYKHFFIRPLVGGPLTSARADLETPYGKAASGWILENGILKIEALIPPNSTATLVLPGKANTTLQPGRYQIEHKLP